MKIILTRHAISRALQRNISIHDIINTVRYPDRIRKEHGKYLVTKLLASRKIELVGQRTRKYIKIITVYWK